MIRRRRLDDTGSILPLTLGYAALALIVIYVCVSATALYLAQKQVDAAADSLSLAGADGFTLSIVDGAPSALLTSSQVRREVDALVGVMGSEWEITRAESPDGVSARVSVTKRWHPPLLGGWGIGAVDVSATATSRTALR